MNKIKAQLIEIDNITKVLIEENPVIEFNYEFELEAYVQKVKERLDRISEKMNRIDETSTTISYIYEQLSTGREQVSTIIKYLEAARAEMGEAKDSPQTILLNNSYNDLKSTLSAFEDIIIGLN